MTIRTTRWRPNIPNSTALCGCVMLFSWDDAEPEDTRVHTANEPEAVCKAHAHYEGAEALFAGVIAEQRAAAEPAQAEG